MSLCCSVTLTCTFLVTCNQAFLFFTAVMGERKIKGTPGTFSWRVTSAPKFTCKSVNGPTMYMYHQCHLISVKIRGFLPEIMFFLVCNVLWWQCTFSVKPLFKSRFDAITWDWISVFHWLEVFVDCYTCTTVHCISNQAVEQACLKKKEHNVGTEVDWLAYTTCIFPDISIFARCSLFKILSSDIPVHYFTLFFSK